MFSTLLLEMWLFFQELQKLTISLIFSAVCMLRYFKQKKLYKVIFNEIVEFVTFLGHKVVSLRTIFTRFTTSL